MNGPIIDPSVFYWINIFGILQSFCSIIGGFILALSLIMLGLYLYNDAESRNPTYVKPCQLESMHYAKVCKKIYIPLMIIGSIMIIIAIFVPSKTTSIEMLIAKTATYENTEWTLDAIKQAVDYIIEAVKSV